MPLVAALFAHYLALSMQPGSSAQNPEKLYRERGLIIIVVLLTLVFFLTTFVRLPILEIFAHQLFIRLP